MRAYWQAKAQLFAWPGLRAAVVNLDDAQGLELADSLAGAAVDCWTVSMRGEAARLRAEALRHDRDGLAFDVVEGDAARRDRDAADRRLQRRQPARASSACCARSASRSPTRPRACAALTPVPGRMQRVVADGAAAGALPEVVVDYAHTPDALEKALAALRAARRARAAAGSGACSAAAATATRPSGR